MNLSVKKWWETSSHLELQCPRDFNARTILFIVNRAAQFDNTRSVSFHMQQMCQIHFFLTPSQLTAWMSTTPSVPSGCFWLQFYPDCICWCFLFWDLSYIQTCGNMPMLIQTKLNYSFWDCVNDMHWEYQLSNTWHFCCYAAGFAMSQSLESHL